MVEDKIEDEETQGDRFKRYRELVAGGKSDQVATEMVWPSTTANMVKNAKEKADRDALTEKKDEKSA